MVVTLLTVISKGNKEREYVPRSLSPASSLTVSFVVVISNAGVSPGQCTACVVWFMGCSFQEAAIFCLLLKRGLKTYKSWENIICLLKARFLNRCIYLLCHHTDGQKMFSCHGSNMYSITEGLKIEEKKRKTALPVVILWQQLLSLSFLALKLQFWILQTTLLVSSSICALWCSAIGLQSCSPWEASTCSCLALYLSAFSLLNESWAVSSGLVAALRKQLQDKLPFLRDMV